MLVCGLSGIFFFFNDTATTEIYTLSLHDALPISNRCLPSSRATAISRRRSPNWRSPPTAGPSPRGDSRSEEHTSELQSQSNLVCRLLLEKKKYRFASACSDSSPFRSWLAASSSDP